MDKERAFALIFKKVRKVRKACRFGNPQYSLIKKMGGQIERGLALARMLSLEGGR